MSLSFTLLASAAEQFAEVLVCLSKFSDTASFEARDDRLALIGLNAGKSAYASFAFDRFGFFDDYDLTIASKVPGSERKYTFSISIKALLPAFRFKHVSTAQSGDGKRVKSAKESLRWLISMRDRPNETRCRLVVKVVGDGITKTHNLTYEGSDIMHALFNKGEAINSWSIYPQILKEYSDFFGPKTEQLDIFLDEEETVHLVSFTDKVLNSKKEVLKHPLKTTVSLSQSEFASFSVVPNLHIIISVKDFRTIVTHASTLKASITAMYSQPTRPLQFSYQSRGIKCQFTLMTAGTYEGTVPLSEVPAVNQNDLAAQSSRQSIQPPASGMPNAGPIRYSNTAERLAQVAVDDDDLFGLPSVSQIQTKPRTPHPVELSTAPRSQVRRLGQAKKVVAPTPTDPEQSRVRTVNGGEEEESLFVPEDEDRQWDPPNYDGEEWLGWDASADLHANTSLAGLNRQPNETRAKKDSISRELAPATQQASEIHGLW